MKDFFEREHIIIDGLIAERLEVLSHFRLPAGVNRVFFHGSSALLKIVSFQIANEETAGLKEVRAGINSARKGWLTKENVLNTLSLAAVRKRLSR